MTGIHLYVLERTPLAYLPGVTPVGGAPLYAAVHRTYTEGKQQ